MKNFNRYLNIFLGLVPPIEEWNVRCFHVSLALQGNKIISFGMNTSKTHSLNLRNRKKNSSGVDFSESKFTCSEFVSLHRVKRKTDISFNKITLLNFRIDRRGNIRYARPCESCRSLINFLGVKECFYTNNDGQFEEYIA